MKKQLFILSLLIVAGLMLCACQKDVTVKIYHTSDVHGNFFPYNFINDAPYSGSLARVEAFLKEKRAEHGNRMLLMDGGDVLQGQPTVYYHNFVDTASEHLCAGVMNYLGYDVSVLGNHDIEPGHLVYDRWVAQCNFPVLGANIIDVERNEPYLPPYHVFEKGGLKIAVLGMITEAIPAWLPENLWEGLRFDNIVKTATHWVPYIHEVEKPDVLVALIHSGVGADGARLTGYDENEGMALATTVPGIDVVFCGHDHRRYCQKVANVHTGDSVLVMDPAANGNHVSDVTIRMVKKGSKVLTKEISGTLVDISALEPDEEFRTHFADNYQMVYDYVNEEIGEFTQSIDARQSFFGSSAFNDLLHRLQLKLTDADISFVAPLSETAFINSGKVYMRDMFKLYRYENLLYTMELTGSEVLRAMEYFHGLSVNHMKSPDDHLLQIRPRTGRKGYEFVHPSFSFDTAAGLYYTVDVTKPAGSRITVLRMANGKPLDLQKKYRVAINSYQGSGGGGILTEGAGIAKTELADRILTTTQKDLRYYLGELIREERVVNPEPLNQWKFIPESWAVPAGRRDYELLFGK